MGFGEAAPTSAVAGYCRSGDTVAPLPQVVCLCLLLGSGPQQGTRRPPPIVFEANIRGAAVIRSMEGTIWKSVWVLLALWG